MALDVLYGARPIYPIRCCRAPLTSAAITFPAHIARPFFHIFNLSGREMGATKSAHRRIEVLRGRCFGTVVASVCIIYANIRNRERLSTLLIRMLPDTSCAVRCTTLAFRVSVRVRVCESVCLCLMILLVLTMPMGRTHSRTRCRA